jgi:hypothetical protein
VRYIGEQLLLGAAKLLDTIRHCVECAREIAELVIAFHVRTRVQITRAKRLCCAR